MHTAEGRPVYAWNALIPQFLPSKHWILESVGNTTHQVQDLLYHWILVRKRAALLLARHTHHQCKFLWSDTCQHCVTDGEGQSRSSRIKCSHPSHVAKTPKWDGLRTEQWRSLSSLHRSPAVKAAHRLLENTRSSFRIIQHFQAGERFDTADRATGFMLKILGHFPPTWMLSQKLLGSTLLLYSMAHKSSLSTW